MAGPPPVTDWPTRIESAWSSLTRQQRRVVELFPPQGTPANQPPRLVLPGSFNPLHRGHAGMAELASQATGHPLYFELSVINADKPQLDRQDTQGRLLPALSGKPGGGPLWAPHGLLLANLPRFDLKARQFPGAILVVGVDTWVRIADPAFYPDNDMAGRLKMIAGSGCRFLVFGRLLGDRFQSLDDLSRLGRFPSTLLDISDPVSQQQFRCDLSSTELRDDQDP